MEPEKYIMQYIVKKTKKLCPSWQDVNELTHAHEKMINQLTAGDSFDYFQKTMKRVRYHREKIGVMVAFVHPDHPDIVAIGYSLCNTGFKSNDKFDHRIISLPPKDIFGPHHVTLPVVYSKADGLGKNIALGRAAEWSAPDGFLSEGYIVPPSIKDQFLKFIERCRRYYKDKQMPEWIVACAKENSD